MPLLFSGIPLTTLEQCRQTAFFQEPAFATQDIEIPLLAQLTTKATMQKTSLKQELVLFL